MSQARNLDFQLFGSCAFPIWSLGRVAEGGERQREAEGGEERGAPLLSIWSLGPDGPHRAGVGEGTGAVSYPPAVGCTVWGEKDAAPPCRLMCSTSSWPPSRTPAPRKDPPWITLVQAEPKKKPAPLPPSSSPGPPPGQEGRQVENGGVDEAAPEDPEPKPYNPFEEEEEAPAAPSPAPGPVPTPPESTPKSLHPWYGITPTSSPKTKKRPAPRAPSTSPLGECCSWGLPRELGPWGWVSPGPGKGRGCHGTPPPGQVPCVLSGNQSKAVGR